MKTQILIQLSPEELSRMLSRHTDEVLAAVREELGGLQDKLRATRPAFSIEEAADYCGKSVVWFNGMRKKTRIPEHRAGGTPMFKKQDLDDMLLGQTWPQDKDLTAPTGPRPTPGGSDSGGSTEQEWNITTQPHPQQ